MFSDLFSTLFIPDHPELDAQIPASNTPNRGFESRPMPFGGLEAGKTQNVYFSGNYFHGSHGISKSVGQYLN